MQSELNIPNKQNNPTFPAFYKSKIDDEVVLFTNDIIGTVVKTGTMKETQNPIGYYSDDWVECTNTDIWEKLPPGSTVTLVQD